MATVNDLQPEYRSVPDCATTVRGAKDKLQGCGKDDGALTLYRDSNELPPTPLSGNYWHVRCGYRPPTTNPKHTGILLCDNCAARFGLLVLFV